MEFRSDLIPAEERARRYRSVLQAYFEGFNAKVWVPGPLGAPGFAASLRTVDLCELSGARHLINAAHSVEATPNGVSPARMQYLDWYLVNEGELLLSTAYADAHLKAGDMMLLDSSQAFRGSSPGVDLIVITLPPRLASGVRRQIGQPIAGRRGFAHCVQALMHTAMAQQSQLCAEEALFIETSIVQALGFIGVNGATSLMSHDAGARQLDELKRRALRCLQEPGLSVESLAREAGISTRRLQRLFERSGTTFSDWLRERRIERCHLELTSPLQPPVACIANVAFKWGFNDLRTFNRAFRRHYGLTPRAAMQSSAPAIART